MMKLITCRDCIYEFVCPNYNSYDDVLNVSDYCPNFKNKADFMEVPCRCGNCKNYNDHICVYFETLMLDDDFCSYGDRREDND